MTLEVVFVAGYGRMGSTLLGQILGQTDDTLFVGELRHIWDRGLKYDQLCECEKRFSECPFWRAVIIKAFGSFDAIREMRPWEGMERLSKLRNLPRIRLFSPHLTPDSLISAYLSMTEQVLDAIETVAGVSRVVDTSKHPNHGFLLAKIAPTLKVLHMTRDSRAVAYSWMRPTPRPEIPDSRVQVRRRGLLESSLAWDVSTVLSAWLSSETTSLTLHYENLMADPARAIERVSTFLGIARPTSITSSDVVFIKSGHSVAGNRSRFRSGFVALDADYEWQGDMAAWQQNLVWVFTWPVAMRMGYRRSDALTRR